MDDCPIAETELVRLCLHDLLSLCDDKHPLTVRRFLTGRCGTTREDFRLLLDYAADQRLVTGNLQSHRLKLTGKGKAVLGRYERIMTKHRCPICGRNLIADYCAHCQYALRPPFACDCTECQIQRGNPEEPDDQYEVTICVVCEHPDSYCQCEDDGGHSEAMRDADREDQAFSEDFQYLS